MFGETFPVLADARERSREILEPDLVFCHLSTLIKWNLYDHRI